MASGLIIADGRSTRFGDQDKALADLGGVPLIRHVADRIAHAVEINMLVANCRDEQLPAIRNSFDGYELPVRFAIDETPDLGPVAGIATGLRRVESDYAFVAACDMPLIDPAVTSFLFTRALGYDGVVPPD